MKLIDLTKVEDVELSDIKLDGINVRTDLESNNSKENLQELADSIKENGLLQPIVLSGKFGFPPHDVIVGQRRFLAHQLLKAKSIKAVFADDISKTDALILSLSENLLRQEMNQADLAEAITKLYVELNRDEYAVQKRLGLSIRAIRGYISVDEQATTKIKSLIRSGKLSIADAKRTIAVAQGDDAKADEIAVSISKLTKYEKSRAVDFGKNNPKASAKEIVKAAKTPSIQETLILNLSFKVSKALKQAVKKVQLESEEIAIQALTNWLETNDFLIA